MRKRKSKLSSFVSMFLVFLVAVLSVGVIRGIVIRPEFSVEYNGKRYKGEGNRIELKKDEETEFLVKGAKGYEVTITPNVREETDFAYRINGYWTYRYGEADLSSAFETKNDVVRGRYTLRSAEEYDLKRILSKLHNGGEVELEGTIVSPYLLTFTNGTDTVSFAFGPMGRMTLGVELSETQLIF